MPEETEEIKTLALEQDTDNLEDMTDEAALYDDDVESDEQETDSSNAAPQKNITANTMLARLFQRESARDGEPYDFERCTVLVLLQLMPLREGQVSDERKVFVSARTHSYPPYVTQLRWDELAPRLPSEIHTLLERLQQDLPQRAAEQHALEEAERERQAQLQAESEKRRAAKKEKASGPTQVNTKQSPQKRTKKIVLNAPPALPDKDEKEGLQSQVTGVQITTNNIEPEPIAPSAQMTMF